jgi:hypothetical protein
MVKGFFLTLVLGAFAALAFFSTPRVLRRTCPVCQGSGTYEADTPIAVGVRGKVVERTRLLCPFCDGGTLSLYDLRQRRPRILQWMVSRQKLPPELLVKRVKEAFGQDGLDELHANNFFMK